MNTIDFHQVYLNLVKELGADEVQSKLGIGGYEDVDVICDVFVVAQKMLNMHFDCSAPGTHKPEIIFK